MKKIYSFLFCFFILSSLQAQMTFTSSVQVINYLNGNWIWFRSCGGLMGTCQYPNTVGYTRDLEITQVNSASDSIWYKLIQNSSVVNLQAVKISTVSTYYSGKWTLENVQSAGSNSISLSLVNATSDTIWLAENCSDCYVQQFVRNKTVGIEELTDAGLSPLIFPNPATEVIHFRDASENRKIRITEISGRFVLEKDVVGTLHVGDLPPGIYSLRAEDQNGKIRTEKLVIVSDQL